VICRSFKLETQSGLLKYTVYRPNHLSYRPPLVCVGGGPGLPSQYLSPLVHRVNDRSIVLYDHVGCGQSRARVPEKDSFCLENMISDLGKLVSSLACKEIHILGHSFGGILVYEYCLKAPAISVLSVTLASTPVSMKAVDKSCELLTQSIEERIGDEDMVSTLFFQEHECRLQPMPLQLQQSYESAGLSSSARRLSLFNDYVASQSIPVSIPAMIINGEHDFVTPEMSMNWTTMWSTCSISVLKGCSHFSMLEDENEFGKSVSAFIQSHDTPTRPLHFLKR